MASPLGDLNLLALADQSVAASQERAYNNYNEQVSWSNSTLGEQQGLLASLLSEDERGQKFTSQQNLLDAALQRQEAAMAEATARAKASSDTQSQAAENAEYRSRLVFAGEQDIINQIRLNDLVPPEPDPPYYHNRDFGGYEMSAARGRALERDFPSDSRFQPTPGEVGRARKLVEEHVNDPNAKPADLMKALRKPVSEGGLGERYRLISVALAKLGYEGESTN